MQNPGRIVIVMAVTVLVAGAAVAAAQPGAGRGARGEAGWTRLAEKLDLTEEQKQTIGAIHAQARTQQLERRKQMVQLEAQLHTMMLADAPDEAAAVKLVGQIGDLRAELQANRIKTRLAVRKQLTPEQRTQAILREGQGGRGHRGMRDRSDDGERGGRHGRGQRAGREIN